MAVRAVGLALPAITRLAEAAYLALQSGGRLVYVGAGTSGRLALLDAAECPPTFGSDPAQVQAVLAGGPGALVKAVEGAEDEAEAGAKAIRALRVTRDDLVIGITASGRTPFVMGALEAARKARARTGLVTSNPKAQAAKSVDLVVAVETGPELVQGSTRLKAGTATKLVLNAVSTAAFVALGHVYRGRMIALRPTNEKLKERARQIVEDLLNVTPARAKKLLVAADGSPKKVLAAHVAAEAVRPSRRPR